MKKTNSNTVPNTGSIILTTGNVGSSGSSPFTAETITCTKCKVEIKYNDWYTCYSPIKNVASLMRNVCQICHTKAMDKLYDIERNVDLELFLYEK
jgi:hypothetical protein